MLVPTPIAASRSPVDGTALVISGADGGGFGLSLSLDFSAAQALIDLRARQCRQPCLDDVSTSRHFFLLHGL